MLVQTACLADAVLAAERGKVTFYGVFDSILAEQFPTRHPSITLALRLQFEHEDGGKRHRLRHVLRDADHRELIGGELEVEAPPIEPGQFGTLDVGIVLKDLLFARDGRYHFAVITGEGNEVRVPLKVLRAAA